jgi:activating signal cointegrator complex subunit 3
VFTVSFQGLLLPTLQRTHTDLLPVSPVPRSALQNPSFEAIYPFSHFNPIQSQLFHVLYHTDNNVLVGAPTGSGKTITGELAILRLLNTRPGAKTIYVAPLKALARERLEDWQRKLGSGSRGGGGSGGPGAIRRQQSSSSTTSGGGQGQKQGHASGLGLRIMELTGDVTPTLEELSRADILIVTPEKWDSISRGWQRRGYVQRVELVIIDEIHLLGADRGPVLVS